MFEEPGIGWRRRFMRATVIGITNVILLVVVPTALLSYLKSFAPIGSVSLSENTIYAFGGSITGLQVLAALTEGMIVSVPFESGGFIATALYIWVAVEGGTIASSVQGFSFVLSFQPLLYLLLLPPLFGALRVPIGYLLDHQEGARASPGSV